MFWPNGLIYAYLGSICPTFYDVVFMTSSTFFAKFGPNPNPEIPKFKNYIN